MHEMALKGTNLKYAAAKNAIMLNANPINNVSALFFAFTVLKK